VTGGFSLGKKGNPVYRDRENPGGTQGGKLRKEESLSGGGCYSGRQRFVGGGDES